MDNWSHSPTVVDRARSQSPGHGSPHYSLPLGPVDQMLLTVAPSERASFNHVLSENAMLRARISALTRELVDAREIFARRGRVVMGGAVGAVRNRWVQTAPIPGMPTLRQAVAAPLPRSVRDAAADTGAAAPRASDRASSAVSHGAMMDAGTDGPGHLSEGAVAPRMRKTLPGAKAGSIDVPALVVTDDGSNVADVHRALVDAARRVAALENELKTAVAAARRDANTRATSAQRAKRGASPLGGMFAARSSSAAPPMDSADGEGASPTRSGKERAYVATLEKALESTRAQLRVALRDLAATPAAPGARRKRTADASCGTSANAAGEIQDIFAAAGIPFTAAAATELVGCRTSAAAVVELRRLAEQHAVEGHTAAALARSLSAEVDDLRTEVLAAHNTIADLQMALDLERRTLPTRSDAATSKAKEDTAQEISFLCDTVAADKQALDVMRQQLLTMTAERDLALSERDAMHTRSLELLKNCEQMAQSSQSDTDALLRRLTTQLRHQETDAMRLRQELEGAARELERTRKQRDTVTGEARVLRDKMAALQQDVLHLRADAEGSQRDLRRARTALRRTDVLRTAPATADVGRDGSPAATSIQALEAALHDEGATEAKPEAEPVATTAAAELELEYEELRGCLLLLADLLPGGATTAREVAKRISHEVLHLRRRAADAEEELQRRATATRYAREVVAASEAEATARMAAPQRAGREAQGKDALLRQVRDLEAELADAQLLAVTSRTEVEEGRHVVLQLIDGDTAPVLLNHLQVGAADSATAP